MHFILIMYRKPKHAEKQSYTKFKRSLMFALLAGGAIGANLLEGIVPVCANRKTKILGGALD